LFDRPPFPADIPLHILNTHRKRRKEGTRRRLKKKKQREEKDKRNKEHAHSTH